MCRHVQVNRDSQAERLGRGLVTALLEGQIGLEEACAEALGLPDEEDQLCTYGFQRNDDVP